MPSFFFLANIVLIFFRKSFTLAIQNARMNKNPEITIFILLFLFLFPFFYSYDTPPVWGFLTETETAAMRHYDNLGAENAVNKVHLP